MIGNKKCGFPNETRTKIINGGKIKVMLIFNIPKH